MPFIFQVILSHISPIFNLGAFQLRFKASRGAEKPKVFALTHLKIREYLNRSNPEKPLEGFEPSTYGSFVFMNTKPLL